ncbi:hypothetical protein ACVWY2_004907 [Bradyrhizobium sp. JR6.1]
MNALSTAAAALYEAINSATSPDELDTVSDAIWHRHWPVGAISDDEAQFLAEAIQKRKPQRRFVAQSPVGKLQARVSSSLYDSATATFIGSSGLAGIGGARSAVRQPCHPQ